MVRVRATPPDIQPLRNANRKSILVGQDGFPYAPQDELETVAIFALLCAQGAIKWQILELKGGKGIDAICWDHITEREIKVEIKYVLSRAGWNHRIEDIDYVVCWENRWRAFPKPVISLHMLLKEGIV